MFHYGFPKRAYRRLTSERWREAEIEMELLEALADPHREAIDIGANVGHYAMQLSRLVPRVHAFEPHPRLAYVLRRNLPGNVHVSNQAVSNQDGRAVLTAPVFSRPVEGMASISPGAAIFGQAERVTRVRVRCTTLDSMAGRDIGFVKVDVEGHEMQVLAGAAVLIAQQRPVFLVEVEERHRAGAVQAAFDYFSGKNYAGFFVWKASLCPVEMFAMAMQDLTLVAPGAPRKSSEYVNNFIFVAREQWSASWELRVTALLSAARNLDLATAVA
jgi:FkbM family methyltransferase